MRRKRNAAHRLSVDGLPQGRSRCRALDTWQPYSAARVQVRGVRFQFSKARVRVSVVVRKGTQEAGFRVVGAFINVLDQSGFERAYIEVSIELGTDAASRMAIVKIRDHGPGVPSSEIEHLFETLYPVPTALCRIALRTTFSIALFYAAPFTPPLEKLLFGPAAKPFSGTAKCTSRPPPSALDSLSLNGFGK